MTLAAHTGCLHMQGPPAGSRARHQQQLPPAACIRPPAVTGPMQRPRRVSQRGPPATPRRPSSGWTPSWRPWRRRGTWRTRGSAPRDCCTRSSRQSLAPPAVRWGTLTPLAGCPCLFPHYCGPNPRHAMFHMQRANVPAMNTGVTHDTSAPRDNWWPSMLIATVQMWRRPESRPRGSRWRTCSATTASSSAPSPSRTRGCRRARFCVPWLVADGLTLCHWSSTARHGCICAV